MDGENNLSLLDGENRGASTDDDREEDAPLLAEDAIGEDIDDIGVTLENLPA